MKKGFSLIVLTIIVTVILILTTAVTVSVISYQRNLKILEFGSEIANIQEKVDSYYYIEKTYPIRDNDEVVSIELSSLDSKAKTQFDQEIVDGSVKLKKLDLLKIFGTDGNYISEINNLIYGLNDGDENDLYLISTKTGKVYYKAGVYGNYTLTDELKDKIDYIENVDIVDSYSGMIFTKSGDNYTNRAIVTNIKIPSKYEVISCNVVPNNGVSKSITLVESGEFKEGNTPDDINSNYKIVVSWKENSTDVKSNITVYNVENFDNKAPTVTFLSDMKYERSSLNNEEYIYYFLDYEDDLSGIETIKYVPLKIEDSNQQDNLEIVRKYMDDKGIKVSGRSIRIDWAARWITVYAKDKAGNETYVYKRCDSSERIGNVQIKYEVNEKE